MVDDPAIRWQLFLTYSLVHSKGFSGPEKHRLILEKNFGMDSVSFCGLLMSWMTSILRCMNCKDTPGPQCASQYALSCDQAVLICGHSLCSSTRQPAFQSLSQF